MFKNRLQKIVAGMVLFAAVSTQVTMVEAATLTPISNKGSSIVNPPSLPPASGGTTTPPASGSSACNVYGCSGSGGTTTPPASGSSACNVYGCSGSGGTITPPASGSSACNVYGCSGSGGTITPPASGSSACNVYGCAGNNPTPAPTPTPGISACKDHKYPHDIDGDWSEIFVRRLYDLCIFEGFPDGTFRPHDTMTRAQLIKTTLNAAGLKPDAGCYDQDCGTPYIDLAQESQDSWQSGYIRTAWLLHIIDMPGDRFYPNEPITRAQTVTIVMKAFGFQPVQVEKSSFFDVNQNETTGYIERAKVEGIVNGVGNGNFEPDRPATRGEIAKIISMTLEKWDTKINE